MNLRITKTSEMVAPNPYVQMLNVDYAEWALNEERAPIHKGRWRSDIFGVPESVPLDLEIGTGNGFFFAHRSEQYPDRKLIGIELKFKPLIQTVRRARRSNLSNMRVVRFHASVIHEIFETQELNDVFIYFPDPWPKKKSFKHRLIQDGYLERLFQLQRPGSLVEFKTDHPGYFDWTLERFQRSRYHLEAVTYDLHQSEWASENFMTHFEKLWTSKGLKTHMLRARRR